MDLSALSIRSILLTALAGLISFYAGRHLASDAAPLIAQPDKSQVQPPQRLDAASVNRFSDPVVPALRGLSASELREAITTVYPMQLNMDGRIRLAKLKEQLRFSDLKLLVAEILTNGNLEDREAMRSRGLMLDLVMQVYAEVDPEAAWKFAHETNLQDRESVLSSVFRQVAKRSPDLALAWAEQMQDSAQKSSFLSVALSFLAKDAPEKAFRLALAAAPPPPRDQRGMRSFYPSSRVLSTWISSDLKGALAALRQLSGEQATEASEHIISALSGLHPQAAWDFAMSLPPTNDRASKLESIIRDWSEYDAYSALQAARLCPDAPIRTRLVANAVSAWAAEEPGAALDYARNLPEPALQREVLSRISQSSTGNFDALFSTVIECFPAGDGFQKTVCDLLGNWAQSDPAGAAAAIEQLPKGSVYTEACRSVLALWLSSGERQNAFAWVKTLQGEARVQGVVSVFSAWGSTGPQEGINALNLLAAEERRKAVPALASGWSSRNPQAVLQWAASLTDSTERSEVFREAITRWVRTSPQLAAQRVESVPPADRAAATSALMSEWITRDQTAAQDWLRRQPSGELKDAAIELSCVRLIDRNPSLALACASQISEENQRLKLLRKMVETWMGRDAAGARNWVAQSDLPAEVRENYLR